MPKAKEATSVLVENKVYVIGGFRGRKLKSIDYLDLKSGKWNTENELPVRMESPALASLEKKIYIYENGKFLVYNTLNGLIKMYSINIDTSKSKMFISNGFIYIVGGGKNESNNINQKNTLIRFNLNQLKKNEVYSFL